MTRHDGESTARHEAAEEELCLELRISCRPQKRKLEEETKLWIDLNRCAGVGAGTDDDVDVNAGPGAGAGAMSNLQVLSVKNATVGGESPGRDGHVAVEGTGSTTDSSSQRSDGIFPPISEYGNTQGGNSCNDMASSLPVQNVQPQPSLVASCPRTQLDKNVHSKRRNLLSGGSSNFLSSTCNSTQLSFAQPNTTMPKNGRRKRKREAEHGQHVACVSTTGNGPDGKTINGILYRYTKNEVIIMCVCHGNSFSPAEFIRHAGGTDVEHPLRRIFIVSN